MPQFIFPHFSIFLRHFYYRFGRVWTWELQNTISSEIAFEEIPVERSLAIKRVVQITSVRARNIYAHLCREIVCKNRIRLSPLLRISLTHENPSSRWIYSSVLFLNLLSFALFFMWFRSSCSCFRVSIEILPKPNSFLFVEKWKSTTRSKHFFFFLFSYDKILWQM